MKERLDFAKLAFWLTSIALGLLVWVALFSALAYLAGYLSRLIGGF